MDLQKCNSQYLLKITFWVGEHANHIIDDTFQDLIFNAAVTAGCGPLKPV
jgi:hypothetical protein